MLMGSGRAAARTTGLCLLPAQPITAALQIAVIVDTVRFTAGPPPSDLHQP
jgi:hypothetical protein